MNGIGVGDRYTHISKTVYDVGDTVTRFGDQMKATVLSRELNWLSDINSYQMEITGK